MSNGLLDELGEAKGDVNAFMGGVLRDSMVDRHNFHAPVPQETPEREGRPSRYCRKCGLRWENEIHDEAKR